MNNPVKKIASISGKVLLWILIIACTVFIVLTLSRKQGNNDAAKFLGYSFLPVQSDSMKGTGKENFQKGDMIIVKSLNAEQKKNLQVGDIITFHDILDGLKILNTHRIEKILYNNENAVEGYITKGDNNPVADETPRELDDITAKYNGTKIGGFGKALDFLQTKTGFFFCLVLPLALFFLFYVYKFIASVVAYKKIKEGEEDEEKVSSNMDEMAQLFADANVDPELIQAAMAKAKGEETKPESEAKPAPKTETNLDKIDIDNLFK